MTQPLTVSAPTLNVREALAELLAGDLEFHGKNNGYAAHALHAFAAKFPPQIPRAFIEVLTRPGDVVLDPMMGSGTTLVEAAMLGRRAVGVDLDPLALRICRVKTARVDPRGAMAAAQTAITQAQGLLLDRAALRDEMARRFDAATREFQAYWFLPETQDELMALLLGIEQVAEARARALLQLVFSSIIVTKSGGVSRARDLAHSRPHRVLDKQPRSAISEFSKKAIKAISALGALQFDPASVEIHAGDARGLPLPDSSVDLIITSPPYANAIDYMRAHKFSLVWFGESVEDLSTLRSTYIGSEKCRDLPEEALPDTVTQAVMAVADKDRRKAAILHKYLTEMQLVLREMGRVLRPGSAAGIVVGPSTMRGVRVETQLLLSDIAASLGFDVVGIATRRLDRDRRMMPARHGPGAMNGIEQRMHEEFVIGLVRP